MAFSGEAFFLPLKEDFFSLNGVARQQCRALKSDACRCECSYSQMYATLVSNGCIAPTPFKAFFHKMIFIS